MANVKLLWATLGPDNPFLCSLDHHSLPEEVGGKKKNKKKKNLVHTYSPSFLLEFGLSDV